MSSPSELSAVGEPAFVTSPDCASWTSTGEMPAPDSVAASAAVVPVAFPFALPSNDHSDDTRTRRTSTQINHRHAHK